MRLITRVCGQCDERSTFDMDTVNFSNPAAWPLCLACGADLLTRAERDWVNIYEGARTRPISEFRR
jgi:hypothetical protein